MAARNTNDEFLRVVLIPLVVAVLVPLLLMAFAMPMMGWGWTGGAMRTGLSPLWGVGVTLVWLVVLAGAGDFLYRSLVG